MIKYPKALEALIDQFSSLPSVGRKTAERFAFYVYSKMPKERIELFSDSLVNLHQQLHSCSCCGNISEEDLCSICKDPERNHKQVLVVEQIKDLFTIENVNEYRGIYHVLGGAISFSKGIGIDDLNLSSLIRKVKNKEVDELILATNATPEGEATATYIARLIKPAGVKVTRLAHGLAVGSDIEYADEMTLFKAIEGRTEL